MDSIDLSIVLILLANPLLLAGNQNFCGHLKISSMFNPLTAAPNRAVLGSALVEKDMVEVLSQILNFTYEFNPPRDVLGLGAIENGTGTGALGQLMRQEVDMFTSGATRTFDKEPYVDSTFPLFYDTVQMMIPFPKIGQNSNALVAIFSADVWLLIGFFTAVVIAVLKCFIHFSKGGKETFLPLSIVGLVASQGTYFRNQSFSIRFVWGTWCLAMVVLVNVYTGTLTSMLTKPSFKFLANSIDDVADNEHIKPYVTIKSSLEEYIRNSPVNSYKTIRFRLNKNPNLLVDITTNFANLIAESDRNVLFMTSTITNGLIVSDTLTWKRCRLTLAKNPLYTRPLGFLLQKNSNLTEVLNKKILLLHQAGLMDQIVRRYTPSPKRCLVTERKTNNKLSKLNLLQMSGSFKILVIGMTVSFTCFVVEMVWPKCSRIQIRCNYRRGCVRNCTCTCKRQ